MTRESDIRIYTWRLLPLINLGLQALFARQEALVYSGEYVDLDRLEVDLRDGVLSDPLVLIADFKDGFEAQTERLCTLRAQYEQLRVIFLLPAYADEPILIHALRVGADGYLLQSSAPDSVVAAIRTVVAGRSYLGPEIAPVVIAELRKPTYVAQESTLQSKLSERERALIQLAADGMSNSDIAESLGLAEKTVRNLWSSLFEKLGMEDRTQAVLWAIRTGQAVLRENKSSTNFP